MLQYFFVHIITLYLSQMMLFSSIQHGANSWWIAFKR